MIGLVFAIAPFVVIAVLHEINYRRLLKLTKRLIITSKEQLDQNEKDHEWFMNQFSDEEDDKIADDLKRKKPN